MSPLPEVFRAEVDGVPVFWSDLPGRLEAHLVFGVGMRDETFVTTGITHVVEHLAMRALGELHYAYNASVGPSETIFEVASSPEVVAEHLRRVCLSLAELDLTGLDVERRVLAVEEEQGGADVLCWLPAELWFGNRSYGLLGNRQIALDTVDPPEITRWCRQWFHRGNVALALTGPPPEGLTLPLPAGDRPDRSPVAPLTLPTPAWTEIPGGFLVSFRATWSAELAAGLQILDNRLTKRLRHEAGLIYDLGRGVTPISSAEGLIGIGSDIKPEHAEVVIGTLLSTLRELCDDGPTPAELAGELAMLREHVESPEVQNEVAFEDAAHHVTGVPANREHYLRGLAGVGTEPIMAALGAARESMVLGVPEEYREPTLPLLPSSPVPPVTGRELSRSLVGSDAPRGSRLVLADEGVSLRIGRDEDSWMTVRYADAVGLGTTNPDGRPGEELLLLASALGPIVPLRAADWRGGRDAVIAARRAVPADLQYQVPDRFRSPDA